MTPGKRIRALRVERKMSQELLAEHLEVSRQAVSKWENDVTYPDTRKLIKLAELFGVSVEYLSVGKRSSVGDAQSSRLSCVLKRMSLCFFIAAAAVHCTGLFTGEFTRNLLPVFPYLWYGSSLWAVILNSFTALFSLAWISFLVIALFLDRKNRK